MPFLIVEKNGGIGGTWFADTDLGADVDLSDHFCPHLSTQKPGSPSQFFIDDFGMCIRIRFNTEVMSVVFDESLGVKSVAASSEGGAQEKLTTQVRIRIVGELSRAKGLIFQALSASLAYRSSVADRIIMLSWPTREPW